MTQWSWHLAGEEAGLHFTSQTGLLQPQEEAVNPKPVLHTGILNVEH